jgi:hypothetical protein
MRVTAVQIRASFYPILNLLAFSALFLFLGALSGLQLFAGSFRQQCLSEALLSAGPGIGHVRAQIPVECPYVYNERCPPGLTVIGPEVRDFADGVTFTCRPDAYDTLQLLNKAPFPPMHSHMTASRFTRPRPRCSPSDRRQAAAAVTVSHRHELGRQSSS